MKVDAIFAADIHMRFDIPECREETEFLKAQEKKHTFLEDLQREHKCPIFVAGDLFHHWKAAPELLSWAFRNLADDIVAIPGQHDLPAHNINNIHRSGIQVLAEAERITLLTKPALGSYSKNKHSIGYVGYPWGFDLQGITSLHDFNIALVHKLVYKGKEPFPGAANVGGTAKSIIKQMPGFDVIVTGDNHQTFVDEYDGTLLVNPGSFMRTTAAQADHKPCVFLWNAEHNEVEQVFLPITKNAVSREHIEVVKERNERVDAFVNKLNSDIEIELSFEANLKRFLAENKVPKGVETIIWEAVECQTT